MKYLSITNKIILVYMGFKMPIYANSYLSSFLPVILKIHLKSLKHHVKSNQ